MSEFVLVTYMKSGYLLHPGDLTKSYKSWIFTCSLLCCGRVEKRNSIQRASSMSLRASMNVGYLHVPAIYMYVYNYYNYVSGISTKFNIRQPNENMYTMADLLEKIL